MTDAATLVPIQAVAVNPSLVVTPFALGTGTVNVDPGSGIPVIDPNAKYYNRNWGST